MNEDREQWIRLVVSEKITREKKPAPMLNRWYTSGYIPANGGRTVQEIEAQMEKQLRMHGKAASGFKRSR